MASMIAGTKYRGQFEQRLKSLIKECLNKDVILFIDEAHTIIGAGSSEGTMDAANILKPYLARGSIKVIGATSHYVIDELDAGPIIEQSTRRVSHLNSIEDLISKGRDLEKIVLSRAIKMHVENKVLVSENKTIIFS